MNQVNNALYKTTLVIGASKLKQVTWYLVNILIIKTAIPGSGMRVFFLRKFGAKIGRGVVLKPYINIKFPWKLAIGDFSWIGEKVWIDNLDQVSIGKSVCVSQGAFLLTGNHNFKKVTFDLITAPVNLEDGVWLGAGSIVCPGVTCGTHAMLSVASVATKHMLAYGIYKGNPAVKTAERIIG